MAQREIYSQGSLDGSCFLYSWANAVRSVTCNPLPEDSWARGIADLPFSTRDFLGGAGTGKLDDSPGALLIAARMFVEGFRCEVSVSEISGSLAAIVEALSSRKAVVAAIDDGDHWVALLEVSGGYAYYACSWKLHNSDRYSEKLSPGKLLYNERCTVKELGLWDGPAFVVGLKSY